MKKREIFSDAPPVNRYLEQSLYQEIIRLLSLSSTISIDFAGYEYISSTFINRAFANLCVEKNWNYKNLLENIIFENLNSDDLEDIEMAVINARERAELINKGIDLHEHFSTVYNY